MPKIEEGIIVAGRFRLGTKLGQGGMGSVWRAMQIGLDTPCAVKFLDVALENHPEMLARFEREAKAAAALRSPHVVAIIDHALWEGVPFIAMELLDGESLGDRLTRVGRLSPSETYRIFTDVCRALTKAHQLGIVHRDLKPDNIFIVKDDDREIAKVLDFGIAKTTGLEASSKTRTGAMLGTPYYMSPEQAQGTRAVDFRSDLWAMGVIAYQCLTGKLPFESEALGDLLMKIILSPLPVPSTVADVPPGFDAWWTKAASRDAAQRFASAKELIGALADALGIDSPRRSDARIPAHVPVSTPQPVLASSSNAFAHTPSPVAHTFSQAPKSNATPKIVAAAIGGLLLVGSIGGLGIRLFGSRPAPAPSAPTVSATASPAAPPSPPSATESAAPAASSAAPPVASEAAPAVTAGAPKALPRAPERPKAAASASAAAPAAAPSAGRRDFGF
jgi:eukaryotic-like serine/threonine-protein kinase